MKKSIIIFLSILFVSMAGYAKLNGDGYYRIKNYFSSRYVQILDNKGSINVQASTVDLKSIELILDNGTVMSDPATVMHVVPTGDNLYNIKAQGTGVYEIIGVYVNVREDKRYPDTYWAYGSKSGMVMYLADQEDDLSMDYGYIEAIKYDDPCRNWYVEQIDSKDDNQYFGVAPTVNTGGEYYASMFADFPFTAASDGTQACYVTKIDKKHGIAVYNVAVEGVAAQVPVFFKCSSADPSANRLDLGVGKFTPKDNLLKGVFFNSEKYNHVNFVAYDKNKMRCLGVTKEGKAGFVTCDYKNVPRNTAYLPVDADCPAELTLMTEEEYNKYLEDYKVEASSVSLDKAEATLTLGDALKLTATVLPADAVDKSVTWTTSDTNIATVDADGNVKAVGVGTATITVETVNGLKATCKVTVKPVVAEQVLIDAKSLTLIIGDVAKLTATVLPENTTDKTVTWATSDEAVATVDQNGHVVAVGEGVCVITATCGDVSATVTTEVARKEQSIVWEQIFEELIEGTEVALSATATSGLDVYFTVEGDNAMIVDNVLYLIAEGEVTVTARQDGDNEYLAAEPVTMTLKVQSGICDVVMGNVTIATSAGQIMINGKDADTKVMVYTINGKLVYAGTANRIPVASKAAYIVRVGSAATKVSVK